MNIYGYLEFVFLDCKCYIFDKVNNLFLRPFQFYTYENITVLDYREEKEKYSNPAFFEKYFFPFFFFFYLIFFFIFY